MDPQVISHYRIISKLGEGGWVSIALIYTGLGETDQAFEWLDKAYNDRAFDLQFAKVDPRFETLRSDSRFQKLLKRMGLVL